MTRRFALPTLAVALLVAASLVFQASGQVQAPPRFVVVVDTPAVERAAGAVTAAERATGAEGEVRIARTPTEQLSVTRFFAAQGYDAIVGVGLDEAVAVAPVAARYPATRFARAGERGLAGAVIAAAARAR